MREFKSHFYQRLDQRERRYQRFKVKDLTVAVKQKLTVYTVKLGPTLLTNKIYNPEYINLKFKTQNKNTVVYSHFDLQLNTLKIKTVVREKLYTQNRVYKGAKYRE